uniref:Uncharacterized protein n=1 Tax=Eptatretus burgeri TaxID=7764 RepID=A0A8C4QKP5_EPTBU
MLGQRTECSFVIPRWERQLGAKQVERWVFSTTSLPSPPPPPPPQSPQPDPISESSGLHYMNAQHWKYVPSTFIDFETELSVHRLPQPSSG